VFIKIKIWIIHKFVINLDIFQHHEVASWFLGAQLIVTKNDLFPISKKMLNSFINVSPGIAFISCTFQQLSK